MKNTIIRKAKRTSKDLKNVYFAYGSNMWESQMSSRCPDSAKIGLGHLFGYKWTISRRGYANVIRSDDDIVEGTVFAISKNDEKMLDMYEGVSIGAYDKTKLKVAVNNTLVDALVYIDYSIIEGVPVPEYCGRINNGILDADLSEQYVKNYIRKFIKK